MADEGPVQVYRAPRPLIDIVSGFLRSHGIETAVSTDDMAGVHPDIGYTLGARLLVPRRDEARARQLIEEVEREDVRPPST